MLSKSLKKKLTKSKTSTKWNNQKKANTEGWNDFTSIYFSLLVINCLISLQNLISKSETKRSFAVSHHFTHSHLFQKHKFREVLLSIHHHPIHSMKLWNILLPCLNTSVTVYETQGIYTRFALNDSFGDVDVLLFV